MLTEIKQKPRKQRRQPGTECGELEDQLRFETLLAETSARLINLAVDRVDDEIRDILHRVCECLGLDRSTLWLASGRVPGAMQLEYFYDRGGLSVPRQLNASLLFPWALTQIMAGKVLAISRLSDLPPEAVRDRESLLSYGTKSTLLIPLLIDGSVFGSVSFAYMSQEREWHEMLVNRLKLLAQIFSNALARKRSEQLLKESVERMKLAADSANAALWTLDMKSGHIWTTEKARKLLGFASQNELTLETFLTVVHIEDRERIRVKMEQAAKTREDFSEEYRIILSDGSVRWMVVRGHPHSNGSGEPDSLLGATVDITVYKNMEEQLRERLQEIEKLKKNLENENIVLQQEVKQLTEQTEIIGQSPAIKRVLMQAAQVAQTGTSVLILGETGTGKALLAQAIHNVSARKNRPMVSVNCAALPPTLIESELFGREKGAFTGALTRMAGRFEVADGSTLFLDEIGELPLELQAKMLRVIEECTFERLGSTKALRVDVRLIAATNRDLAGEVEKGRFRSDLFYRLNVFPIVIPPLRERPDDIPLLVWAFVTDFQKKMGKRIDNIPKKTMDALQSYEWPGNGRELRNIIERAMIVSSGRTLEVLLPEKADITSSAEGSLDLSDVERRHIISVLKRTSWHVTGKGGAAQILGMKGTTLQSRMKKLGIRRPES